MEAIKKTQLRQLQALPLPEKIQASLRRIREWFGAVPDAVVSFSGGLDSTVLLHLVRTVNQETLGVFADTGLEYPEIRDFVNTIPNIIIVKPKFSFLEVVQKYGYPVVSKRVSDYINDVQRTKSEILRKYRLDGIRKDGTKFNTGMIPLKWQFLCNSGIKISDKCCDYLKKQPMLKYKNSFIGVRTDEGSQREQSWYREGCNSLSSGRSWPLAFWLDADIKEYIKIHNLPYSKIYDMGYPRTGCMFCMFGLHLEKRPNRFDLMKKTHPQIYKWCMDGPLNLREVIMKVYKMDIDNAVIPFQGLLDI